MVSKKLRYWFDKCKLVRIGFKYKLKTIRKLFLISLVKPLKC